MEALNTLGISLDVTVDTIFAIASDSSCSGATCTADVAGPHTVTARYGVATATATLNVMNAPLTFTFERFLAPNDMSTATVVVVEYAQGWTDSPCQVAADAEELIAMRLTGHKTRSVFDRYNIVSPNDLRDAVRRLNERGTALDTIIAGSDERAKTANASQEERQMKSAKIVLSRPA